MEAPSRSSPSPSLVSWQGWHPACERDIEVWQRLSDFRDQNELTILGFSIRISYLRVYTNIVENDVNMTSFVVCGQQLCAAKNCNITGLSQKAFASGSNIIIRNKQANQIRRPMKTVSAAAATDKIPPRPDASGRYGQFGGKYVPETLIAALEELEKAYADAMADEAFKVRVDSRVMGEMLSPGSSG